MSSINEELTDPNAELKTRFSRGSNASTGHMNKLREKLIYSDGAVSAKYKVLAATLWSVSARCEPCLKYYAQKAYRRGVKESEIAEFLAVATAMGGCVGETWALKAFKAFVETPVNESIKNTAGTEREDCNC